MKTSSLLFLPDPYSFFWFWFGCKEYHHALGKILPRSQLHFFIEAVTSGQSLGYVVLHGLLVCFWLSGLSPAGYTVFNEMSTCSKQKEKKSWRHSPYMGRHSERFVGSNPPNERNGFRSGTLTKLPGKFRYLGCVDHCPDNSAVQENTKCLAVGHKGFLNFPTLQYL